jgi:hypothetical protein
LLRLHTQAIVETRFDYDRLTTALHERLTLLLNKDSTARAERNQR